MFPQKRKSTKNRDLQYHRSQSAPLNYGRIRSIVAGPLAIYRTKTDIESISSDESLQSDGDNSVFNARKKTAGNKTSNKNEDTEPVRGLDYRVRLPRRRRMLRQMQLNNRNRTRDGKYLFKPQKKNPHQQNKNHFYQTKGICLYRYKNRRRMTMRPNEPNQTTGRKVNGSRKPTTTKKKIQSKSRQSKKKGGASQNLRAFNKKNRSLKSSQFRQPLLAPENWIHPCDPRMGKFYLLNKQNRIPTVYLIPQWKEMLKPTTQYYERASLALSAQKTEYYQTPQSTFVPKVKFDETVCYSGSNSHGCANVDDYPQTKVLEQQPKELNLMPHSATLINSNRNLMMENLEMEHSEQFQAPEFVTPGKQMVFMNNMFSKPEVINESTLTEVRMPELKGLSIEPASGVLEHSRMNNNNRSSHDPFENAIKNDGMNLVDRKNYQHPPLKHETVDCKTTLLANAMPKQKEEKLKSKKMNFNYYNKKKLNRKKAMIDNFVYVLNKCDTNDDLERTEHYSNRTPKLDDDAWEECKFKNVELAAPTSELKMKTQKSTNIKSIKDYSKQSSTNANSSMMTLNDDNKSIKDYSKQSSTNADSSMMTLNDSTVDVKASIVEQEKENIPNDAECGKETHFDYNELAAAADDDSMHIKDEATNAIPTSANMGESVQVELETPLSNAEIIRLKESLELNTEDPSLSDSSSSSGDSLKDRISNLFELINKFPISICGTGKSYDGENSSALPFKELDFSSLRNRYNSSMRIDEKRFDFRQGINQINAHAHAAKEDVYDVAQARPNPFQCNVAAQDIRYFEKHQSHSYQGSKYSSKRDYERDRSSYRERDISPGPGVGGSSLNNGNSYRSQSPDIDSPSSRGGGGGGGGGGHGSHDIRDRGDHRGGGRGGSGERYSYIQKMRDRDRDVYKKDKYSDKRDRRGGGGSSGGNDRDSESYRTNHDRERRGAGSGGGGGGGAKLCSSRDNDKRSGSDDRERERDRDLRDIRDKRDRASDRDRDIYKKDKYSDKRERGGDRGERVARCGDWSEHVSSSGKMYYYNCKTEVSQWEKPKEWLDRERNLPRDQHREKDYRDKDRERDRDDRFARSAYTKHSSSRDNSRLRWNYDNDGGPPSHRRRLDGRHNENADMDISGDSTPTSEASYSLTGTPTAHGTQLNDQNAVAVMPPGTLPCTLGNALPRLASHPNPMPCATSSASSVAAVSVAMHFPTVVATIGGVPMNSAMSATVPSIGGATIGTMPLTTNSLRNAVVNAHLGATTNASVPTLSLSNQVDHHLNSNAPGPPIKIMNSKDSSDFLIGVPHKSTLIMRHHSAHNNSETTHHMLISGNASTDTPNHVYNSANAVPLCLRDNPVNSPLYNVTHQHHSPSPLLNYTKSPISTIVGHTNNVNATSSGVVVVGGGGVASGSAGVGGTGMPTAYSCNSTFGLKTVEGGLGIGSSSVNAGGVLNSTSGIGAVSGISVITSMGSNSSMCSSSLANVAGGGVGHVPGEGPPTPTQELDIISTVALEQQQQQQQQRKPVDNTSSSSLSTLQGCVGSSAQAGNMRGPEISPKLAKFYRPDLISHVTNWQAEALERQAQKCSDDTHMYGDLTCTRICAELKCARSLVRSTEINATLQEQKVMYLRQQIRRLEQSKTQNSFMSDDT